MPTAFLPDRAILSVTGEEARPFLQNLVTCDVEALRAGDVAFGALLTPQGKILFDFFVVCVDGETFFLDTAADQAGALAKRLSIYKLRAKVAVAATTKQVVAVWATGVPPEGFTYRDPRHPDLGSRVIIDIVDDPGRTDAYDAHRIALGIPKGGVDFPWSEAFPHDVNMDWLSGVSFTKGCYVGQEVVSRMQHRGTARRRILRATFEGIAPAQGTEIRAGETLLGTVGSSVGLQGMCAVRIDRLQEAQQTGQGIQAAGIGISLALPA